MTSDSEVLSASERDEIIARESGLKLLNAMKEIGETRLLTRSLNWQRFLYIKVDESDKWLGDPSGLRKTESRSGLRLRWARQKALRSGGKGLIAALGLIK